MLITHRQLEGTWCFSNTRSLSSGVALITFGRTAVSSGWAHRKQHVADDPRWYFQAARRIAAPWSNHGTWTCKPKWEPRWVRFAQLSNRGTRPRQWLSSLSPTVWVQLKNTEQTGRHDGTWGRTEMWTAEKKTKMRQGETMRQGEEMSEEKWIDYHDVAASSTCWLWEKQLLIKRRHCTLHLLTYYSEQWLGNSNVRLAMI